jgi:hypothetical protein
LIVELTKSELVVTTMVRKTSVSTVSAMAFIAKATATPSLVATEASATPAKPRVKPWVKARIVAIAASSPTVHARPPSKSSPLRRHNSTPTHNLGEGTASEVALWWLDWRGFRLSNTGTREKRT